MSGSMPLAGLTAFIASWLLHYVLFHSLQQKHLLRLLLHRLPRIQQREIRPLGPLLSQIAIMRASRVTRLPRCIDYAGIIPIAYIQHQSYRRAIGLQKVGLAVA